MAISQQGLAEKLDISQVTVCRALRGDSCVKPELRLRVLDAAHRHGYPVAARFRKDRIALQHVVCSLVDIQPGRDRSTSTHAFSAGSSRAWAKRVRNW